MGLDLVKSLSNLRERGLPAPELLRELQRLNAEEVPKIKRQSNVSAHPVATFAGFGSVLILCTTELGFTDLLIRDLNILMIIVLVGVFAASVIEFFRADKQSLAADQIRQMLPAVETLANKQLVVNAEAAREGAAAAPHPRTFLITMHGVNSKNEGFDSLRPTLEQRLPGLVVYNGKYDHRTVAKISPTVRANAYWHVFNELSAASANLQDNDRVFMLVHSFGTIAVVHALQGVIPNLKLEGIIWVGCALSPLQNWNWLHALYPRKPQQRVRQLNIARPFDCVLPWARFVDGGQSGSMGFVSMGWTSNLPDQTFKDGGHCGYVNDADEITNFIAGQPIPLVSFADWKRRKSWLKRLLLWFKNLV